MFSSPFASPEKKEKEFRRVSLCACILRACLSHLYHLQSTRFPLSMEFFRQEHWSRLSFPSPGDLPDPGIVPGSPALQADYLPCEPQGSPIYNTSFCQFQSPLSSLPPNLPQLPCGCKVNNCYPCVTLCDLKFLHTYHWCA